MKHDGRFATWGVLLLWLVLLPAHATTRAWLDRQQIALGESVTLSIETDQVAVRPDLSPLHADFEVSARASNSSVSMVNGTVTARTTHVTTLTPQRVGALAIPALRVGNESTAPLVLSVSGTPTASTSRGNASAFLETEVDDATPYVQQSVGVTVRLFYAVPLVSGQLDLDTPEGASLQQVGKDVQTTRQVNGRNYNVVERRFLLVPDRSGALVIPGPRFSGRGAGGWMDDLLGGNSRDMRASGSPRAISVRAQPANAPQPWLPLRDLRLRYVAAPQAARAGEAATLVVEAVMVGATQSQMPELPVPSITGAQVFAEPPQYDESFSNGSPQVKLTRRYSIVPNGAGKLVVPGLQLAWWDVRAGEAKTASLPDLSLQVARGVGGFAANTLPDTESDAVVAGTRVASAVDGQTAGPLWKWAAAAFAALWLLTLVWALRRRTLAPPRKAVGTSVQEIAPALPTHTLADLKRALHDGDLDEVGDVLRGMSTPPSTDLDALIAGLDSPVQRQAIEQLRRVRWAGGDGVAARAALREAFRNGPCWQAAPASRKEILPPLYPPAK
ncbi:MAG: BatD family protein [Pseudoxanthomonas sp.]